MSFYDWSSEDKEYFNKMSADEKLVLGAILDIFEKASEHPAWKDKELTIEDINTACSFVRPIIGGQNNELELGDWKKQMLDVLGITEDKNE